MELIKIFFVPPEIWMKRLIVQPDCFCRFSNENPISEPNRTLSFNEQGQDFNDWDYGKEVFLEPIYESPIKLMLGCVLILCLHSVAHHE